MKSAMGVRPDMSIETISSALSASSDVRIFASSSRAWSEAWLFARGFFAGLATAFAAAFFAIFGFVAALLAADAFRAGRFSAVAAEGLAFLADGRGVRLLDRLGLRSE
jgi:hypothetical protein